MVKMDDIKTDFTYQECRIMTRILIFNENSSDLTLSKIASNAKLNMSDPRFYKIIKYLFDNEIITLNDPVKKTYFIHQKKLRDVIDEQEVINEITDYLKIYHYFTW